MTDKPEPMEEIRKLKRQARVIVCGLEEWTDSDGVVRSTIRSGGWSRAYLDHQWVREADAEGWARDLRAYCIRKVFSSLLNKRPAFEPSDHMPSDGNRAYWRKSAARYAEAAKWQRDIIEKRGDMDAFLSRGRRDRGISWTRGSSKEFAAMQRRSASRGLHMTLEGLSDTSSIASEHKK
jgi:hypothetical protein